MSIPSQFQGTWMYTANEQDYIVNIYSNDIVEDGTSFVQLFQSMVDIIKTQAESYGYDFSSKFTQSSQSDYYTCTLTMTVSGSNIIPTSYMATVSLCLNSDASLTMSLVVIDGSETTPLQVTCTKIS